jgi:hypothetical protein
MLKQFPVHCLKTTTLQKRVRDSVDDKRKNYCKPIVPNHQCSLNYKQKWAMLNYQNLWIETRRTKCGKWEEPKEKHIN